MRLHRLLIAAALLVTSADAALGQNPPAGAPPAGRGGGRGRGRAIQVMSLSSTAFNDGSAIPVKYSQAGEEASPPLSWTGAPDSIASFLLIVHDVNAVSGNNLDDVLHWMVWNIPPTATSLREGIAQGGNLPDGSRQISQTGPYYRGPAAPSSGPPHHYVFELYALDTMVDVPAVGQSPAATRAAVMTAIAGHVRGKAVTIGTFKRAMP